MGVIVPGYGPRDAKIMLVGEAPAREEVKKGLPFQGRAGDELNNLLRDAGIKRDHVYVTNASLNPVVGDKELFFFTKKKGKGLPTDIFLEGIAQLYRDIQEIKPNVVVPMGNYALWALRMHQQITLWRGSILWSDLANVKIVPTFHPAALLRGQHEEEGGTKQGGGMWKMRPVVIWDLQRAKAQSLYPEIRRKPRTILVNPEGSLHDMCLERLLRSDRRMFDVETYGGKRLACIGFGDGYDDTWSVVWSFDDRPDRADLFRRLLEDDTKKMCQNGMYDFTLLDQLGIHTKNYWWDTMYAQHVLVPQHPKSLQFLTSVYTDIPYYKDEGKIWKEKELSADRRHTYFTYCGKDICAQTEVAVQQIEELKERHLTPVFRQEMEVFEPLRWATYHGIPADIRFMMEITADTIKKRDEAQAKLNELAGKEVNANSTPQVRTFLNDQGIAPRFKKGKQTADAKVLHDIAAKTQALAPILLIKVRQYNKLLSNYYNPKILSPDGRVRSVYNPAGTYGSRLSSSEPLWGPGCNAQNWPYRHGSKARRILVAEPGFEVWEFDQAQADAIVVAYLANDPVHLDCFRNGKDVHRVTACLLTDIPAERWKDIPKTAQIRQLAKTCNHELNYDASAIMFMLTVNDEYDPDDPESFSLTKDLAYATWSKYHEVRPALRAWWESTRIQLKQNNRTLRTPLGRECQFLDQWSASMLRQAYAYVPAATVGDVTNIAICQTYDSEDPDIKYLFKHGMRLANQVHDSSAWMVPLGARDYAMKMAMGMKVPMMINGYPVTIPIEAQAGPNFYKGDMVELGRTHMSPEDQ